MYHGAARCCTSLRLSTELRSVEVSGGSTRGLDLPVPWSHGPAPALKKKEKDLKPQKLLNKELILAASGPEAAFQVGDADRFAEISVSARPVLSGVAACVLKAGGDERGERVYGTPPHLSGLSGKS